MRKTKLTNKPILRNLQPIRHPILRHINRPLITNPQPISAQIITIHRPLPRRIKRRALTTYRLQNRSCDCARVGDVDLARARGVGVGSGGQGDTVWLQEGVVDEGDGAGGGAESVGC